MNTLKADTQLNIALDLPDAVREKTYDLDVGYNATNNTWEVIVKYVMSLDKIKEELNVQVTELAGQYAIIIIPQDQIARLADYDEIIFIEKPKRLFFEVSNGINVSCIRPVQQEPYNLSGKGTLVAIIDSGIDYSHPDFRNEDGTTRIRYLWDQTIEGNPPKGYTIGTEYTMEEINRALQSPSREEMLTIVPSIDASGHGTHVAGIACGNGRASGGKNRGVAFDSEILIVKLGSSLHESFPKTSQLMQAINYVIEIAVNLTMPLAVNISFGNSYGSHSGDSLLETYIDEITDVWKTSVAVGTGNEGASGRHASGILTNNATQNIEITVSENETGMNLQIWKYPYDFFDIKFHSPDGRTAGPFNARLGTQMVSMGDTTLYIYYSEPTPFTLNQEIYIEFVPTNEYITNGIWNIQLIPRSIIQGNYNMWLPTGGALNVGTKFVKPSVETTLTIPATAQSAIAVGAYDGNNDSLAFFSGRGYTVNNLIKPDIVAPGVNIVSASPNGGYTARSGTSMATPFVTGSAALLMQWGIVNRHDPFLYGEKIKAYLIQMARELPITSKYPDETLGFGALCLRKM